MALAEDGEGPPKSAADPVATAVWSIERRDAEMPEGGVVVVGNCGGSGCGAHGQEGQNQPQHTLVG